MGVDLTLLPVDGNCGTWGFAHSVLGMDCDRELWERVEALKPAPRPDFALSSYFTTVPDGTWRGERGYGEVRETPYGEPLTYCPAGALAGAVRGHYAGRPGLLAARHRTRAALAYLEALPPETPVALYWH